MTVQDILNSRKTAEYKLTVMKKGVRTATFHGTLNECETIKATKCDALHARIEANV